MESVGLKVSRILHAGYLFECKSTRIVFDPIFENPLSRNCHAFPSVQFDHEEVRKQKFDAVFISHYHDDHCSFDSLVMIERSTPIYLFCVHEELFDWIQQLGFSQVIPLELNRAVKIGEIEVQPRRALDADVDSIFHIKAAGSNVLNVVDSWIDPETFEKLCETPKWDLVLWPFQTMRELEVLSPSRVTRELPELPSEWIEQLQVLKPKIVVPSSCQFKMESWSWYNQAFFPISYQMFEKKIKEILPETRVLRLNPSVSVVLDNDSVQMSEPISWIKPIGEQNVDYEYNNHFHAPLTSEVSKHFEALSEKQTQRVINFCQAEILEKYNSMEAPLDPYFEKPRLWRLSVYDHKGEVKHFDYTISENHLKPTNETQLPVGWLTEVPLAKLFAALELGESLTSMYLRINDVVFEPQIESEIQSADILEDPLIRCLFNGTFGAYQAAQLKRLVGANEKTKVSDL